MRLANWQKVWLVLKREYLFNFRRPAFLFTAFGVPVFIFVMWYFLFNVIDSTVSSTGQLGTIGYVDEVGVLADAVDKPDEYLAFTDRDAAQQALEAGASMINDQWGLKKDPHLAELAAERGIPIILMSNQRDKGGYDAGIQRDIAYYDNVAIEIIVMVFMVLSGIHFALLFNAFTGKIKYFWKSNRKSGIYIGSNP